MSTVDPEDFAWRFRLVRSIAWKENRGHVCMVNMVHISFVFDIHTPIGIVKVLLDFLAHLSMFIEAAQLKLVSTAFDESVVFSLFMSFHIALLTE